MSSRFTVDNLLINNDMTTLGEVKGTKHSLIFSQDSLPNATGAFTFGDCGGIRIDMIRPGSITGIGINFNIDVLDGTGLAIYIEVNGTRVWDNRITHSGVGDNQVYSNTQARNTDTFAAGDYIKITYQQRRSQIASDAIGNLEIIFDE